MLCNNQNLYISQATPIKRQSAISDYLTKANQNTSENDYSIHDKNTGEHLSDEQQINQITSIANHSTAVNNKKETSSDPIEIREDMPEEDIDETVNLTEENNSREPLPMARSDLGKGTPSKN